ncbi:MAG: hypothetical protein ACYCWW_18355 [Deltaproteobacteria bacterium]
MHGPRPAPYTPRPAPGTSDDFRCFLLDWPEKTTKYVVGFNERPSDRSEVHHGLMLVMSGAAAALYAPLDGADGRPGWSCPNGLALADGWLGGWVPGFNGESLPPGLGHRVEPGSKILLTQHYTSENGTLGPDQTSLDFALAGSVDHEMRAIVVMNPAWALGQMPIPAGASDVEYDYQLDPATLSLGRPITLWAGNLHMHERGKKALLGIRHADGGTEGLLEIPRWSYHWVGEDYFLTEPLTLRRGDQLYVECHFDNSAAHQLAVNGIPQTPKALNWGNDGEMCIGFAEATW